MTGQPRSASQPPAVAAAGLAAVAWPHGAHRLDCVSDVHLSAHDPATAAAFLGYLRAAAFDALCILGDLFEVWVGDDLLQADDPEAALARDVAAALRAVASSRPVYLMHGNRDFLLGPAFAAASGATLLADPCLLDTGGWRWLLAHGDAWCVHDADYQRFRAQARSAAWQADFAARPLAERQTLARALRAQSRAHQAQRVRAGMVDTGDVDADTVEAARQRHGANGVIHGHTHRPAAHRLPGGAPRLVLSDWDALAQPPRLQVLQLAPGGRWCVAPANA
ncbi:UDP-2,3-diacylglucosamine hydrolase [Tepidimonas aquatica]|uniref:UDP-2,3-diacylglucosamine hydrolase n=1 Tax=Tepidimonas aquatica TaxID=247482 RepID=A0A554WPT8_9BURK|nr:UDP-2,3-diacylglucosamine hydrolase [Tepidimonas aquatica]